MQRVLKRIVSMRWFFEAPKPYVLTYTDKKIFTKLRSKIYICLNVSRFVQIWLFYVEKQFQNGHWPIKLIRRRYKLQ